MGIKLLKAKQQIYRSSVGLKNKIKYGTNGPEFGELIYINPNLHVTSLPFKHRSSSGKVMSGDWDLQPQINLESTVIYKACHLRWEKDIPWEKTGIYDFMLDKIEKFGGFVDGCSNLEDVIIRYQKLDKLFKQISQTRRLKTQKELNPSAFNEHGGLLFHIDRNNIPIYGGGGMHRFAMAKILNLNSIPAQLGVVHLSAIKDWKLHKSASIIK